jgi:DNA-binding IclR family transcriptional regulator
MVLEPDGFQLYKSAVGNSIVGAASAGAGKAEKYEKVMDEKSTDKQSWTTQPHMQNLFQAIRARDYKLLHADIEIGARSAAFCHLANIAYRVGRTLRMNESAGRFLGDDQANSMLTRNYRAPYVVPENV